MGNSSNAVKTQIWIAISTYVLVAIIKKRLLLTQSMSEILQVISITLFEKRPLNKALFPENQPIDELLIPNQLRLFDL